MLSFAIGAALISEHPLEIRGDGLISSPALSTPGFVLRLNNEPVQIFEYASESVLEQDIRNWQQNRTSLPGAVCEREAYYVFRKGTFLVLYRNADLHILTVLTCLLGPSRCRTRLS